MRSIAMVLCWLLLFPLVSGAQQPEVKPTKLSSEYSHTAEQIIGSAIVGNGAYEKLEYLSDRIGNRLSGTPQLDQAIQWAVAVMKADGLENVHTEPVMVPHWV